MLICDTHCDTLYVLAMHPGQETDITPLKLEKAGVSLQTLAMFTGGKPDLDSIQKAFDRMYAVWDGLKASGLRQVRDPGEAREGGTKYMLSVEGCDLMGASAETLDHWENMGVRMAALTWNHPNALATPHCVNSTDGLTPFGRESVKRMIAKKIAVDVSHLNEQGFWDVLESGAVPLASHSCARALCAHTRNLTDRQLRALFEAGGYVGVNFYPHFLSDRGTAGLEDIIRHLRHMIALGGEDHVGFGSDFDGIEVKPDGLRGPEDLPALIARAAEAFGQDIAEKIAGKNLIDYYGRL